MQFGPDEYAKPPPMHRRGKQDTIYIYDTSDRSKQKLPVDVEISFFLTSGIRHPTFFGYLMLIKIKYGRYNKRRVRTHESDSEVTVRRLGKMIQRIFFFLLNQEPAFAESFGNGLERLVPQFLENFRRYDFCPVYTYFALTNKLPLGLPEIQILVSLRQI